MIKKELSYPSFCTSNFDVIESIFLFAKNYKLPILIESTSNQVNLKGGYTGLTPKNFIKKLKKLQNFFSISNDNIIVGGDHLGPIPWKEKNERTAIKNSIKLIDEKIKSGYKKIHIDTTIKLKNDLILDKNKIFRRLKKIFLAVSKKNLKEIYFVFGSEVPAAGGKNKFKYLRTSLNSIKLDYVFYKNLIRNTCLSFSIVIEPGMGFDNLRIYGLRLKNFKKKLEYSKKNNFSYEAHSTDYQPLKFLKQLVSNNFKFLKVGPELTNRYLKIVLNLEKIEKKFNFKKKSNISIVLSDAMNRNNNFWKDYYLDTNKLEFFKFNSYLDRCRYYWNNKKVISSLKILKKNINCLLRKKLLNLLKFSKKNAKIKNKLTLNNFNFLIYLYLVPVLKKYYKACNYKL